MQQKEDFIWDYDATENTKPKINTNLLVSLTRDWLGREDPDNYPIHGFFPVWAAALLCLAGILYTILLLKWSNSILNIFTKFHSFLLHFNSIHSFITHIWMQR